MSTLKGIKEQAILIQGLAGALRICTDIKIAYGLAGALENHLEIMDDMFSQMPMKDLGFVKDIRHNETPEQLDALVVAGWDAVHQGCGPVTDLDSIHPNYK